MAKVKKVKASGHGVSDKSSDGRTKALSSKPVTNPVHAGAKQRFGGVYKYSKKGPKGG